MTNNLYSILLAFFLSLMLAGCNSDSGSPVHLGTDNNTAPTQPDNSDQDSDDKSDNTTQPDDFTRTPITSAREGTSYDQCLDVDATGDTICFTVFEPSTLDVDHLYPLVLNGPGYGGSRDKTPTEMITRLRDNGYYVITMDPRGFGDSSGTVRVMDPEYYGLDMVAVLDWAEDLPGLRRDPDGNMRVGSYGGSYGGMFQLLLAGVDPQHRLRVLAPDITPHNLNYSLNSGNVVKSGWGLLLVAGGEANSLPVDELQALADNPDPSALANKLQQLLGRVAAGTPLREDTTIFEILLKAGLSNQFDASAQNFFNYHSVSYFCDAQPLEEGVQQFLLPTSIADQLIVPPTPYPKMNVLLTQGMKDTLFNYNNGYDNYQCLKKAGGDVRLLSHQGGHIVPLSVASIPAGEDNAKAVLDPFYAAINLPEFQGPGGAEACGPITVADANFAWFQEYLQGIPGAIDEVITSGTDFCMSLDDGDAIALQEIPHGGSTFELNASTSPLNSVLGILGSLLGSIAQEQLQIAQPLYTEPEHEDADDTTVVAGFPLMDLDMQEILGIGEAACSSIPELPLGTGVGCDPILYLGIGIKRAGSQAWEAIDGQLTPIRGFGSHQGEMNAISIRLHPGDQLGLLAYAFSAQYPITWSRDLLVPAVTLSGNISLPFIDPADIRPIEK